MSRILGPDDIEQGIVALAAAIRGRTAGKAIALVGIRSRGDEVAEFDGRHGWMLVLEMPSAAVRL